MINYLYVECRKSRKYHRYLDMTVFRQFNQRRQMKISIEINLDSIVLRTFYLAKYDPSDRIQLYPHLFQGDLMATFFL